MFIVHNLEFVTKFTVPENKLFTFISSFYFLLLLFSKLLLPIHPKTPIIATAISK